MAEYKTHIQEGILLNANESSLNVDQDRMNEILEEISKLSLNRYPDTTCQSLHALYGKIVNVPAKWILSGNGSDQMLGFLIQYYVQNQKVLYTLSPDFSMYDYYAEINHAKVLRYKTNLDGTFDVDDFILKGLKNRVDMILFSNPNNPTGHSLTRQEMKKIILAFKNIPVIFDEAYIEFGTESAVPFLKDYLNVFVCRTLSKAYGLAGIRCGFLIGQQIEQLASKFVPYALSSVTQTIAMVALKHVDEYREKVEKTISERERMYSCLKDFKNISIYPSNANFLYGRCQNKDKLFKLFEQKNIRIRNYEDDSFRITIGTIDENDMVLDILRRFEYATD